MTAHVAQFLITDEEWRETYAAIRASLVPGGRLYFDSRDPDSKAWESWNPAESRRDIVVGDRTCTVWTETTGVRKPDITVDFTQHYEFSDGVQLRSEMSLRFRDERTIRASLGDLGYRVDVILGGWHGEPVGAGEFLVEARAVLPQSI